MHRHRATCLSAHRVEVVRVQAGKLSREIDDAIAESVRAGIHAAAPVHRHLDTILTITADMDFISIDHETRDKKDAKQECTQINIAKDSDGGALLTGTSLIGALRSRAAWLCEIVWLRDPDTPYVPKGRSRDDDTCDNRFCDFSAKDGLATLSSVERLFGVSGWAGLLRIGAMSRLTPGDGIHNRTNTAMDRFSGGALNGALFCTKVSRKPAWSMPLIIDAGTARDRVWTDDMRRADLAFVKILIDDICENGLALGHGSARGLGWMTVTQTAPSPGTSTGTGGMSDAR